MSKNEKPGFDVEGQKDFDNKYITSSEIQKLLKVDRSSILYARKRGMLPNPIVVKGVNAFIWNRDDIMPYIDAWELQLKARRGELA